MMTNVDLEGFRDWSDKELEEAIRFIRNELNDRQIKKKDVALTKVKEAFDALEKECGSIVLRLGDDDDAIYYNLEDLYLEIKGEINERYK